MKKGQVPFDCFIVLGFNMHKSKTILNPGGQIATGDTVAGITGGGHPLMIMADGQATCPPVL